MELIAKKFQGAKRPLTSFGSASEMYSFAKEHVENHREAEFNASWNQVLEASKTDVTEKRFMMEYVWCVHVAGFSAARVSRFYDKLLVAHNVLDEEGEYRAIAADNLIDMSDPEKAQRVWSVWKNKAKGRAVQSVRKMLMEQGWEAFHEEYLYGRKPGRIYRLPFMGPALACQLARNLGNTCVAKPDVHLTRLARQYGFADAGSLCLGVSSNPAGYTDLVLWYASVDHGTMQ